MKMKNWLAGLLVLAMLAMMAMPALAADMGVQIIGGPEEEATEPVSLDDIKIGTTIVLEDDCEITPVSSEISDKFVCVSITSKHNHSAGDEADYLLLHMDFLNLKTKPVTYHSDVSVIVVSDDKYEFKGWCYQCGSDGTALHSEGDWSETNPMYVGHYLFGCTLPNRVCGGDEPLRMEIKIGEIEMTYNVRK